MNVKKYLEINQWSRKDHFQFFQDFAIPRFNLTVPLDVEKFYQWTKRNHLKFYFALMHLLITEMNQIENFRYRIEGKKVWDAPIEYVSFTDMIPGTNLFKMVFAPFHHDPKVFQDQAILASETQGKTFFNKASKNKLNTVYITSFPWGQFTQLSHATKLGTKDSVPRLSWSQFLDGNGQKTLNLSIEVHHGLVDGFHVGQLLTHLKAKLNQD